MNKTFWSKYSWVVPVLGAVAVIAVFVGRQPGSSEAAKMLMTAKGTTGQASCVGAKKCLVAVIAPWCGYCRKSTPMIKALLQKYKGASDFAVNAVVTADEDHSMESYAGELGSGAFYDPGNVFSSAMGVRGFPTWVLLDASAKVIKSASGAYPDVEQLFAQFDLKQ